MILLAVGELTAAVKLPAIFSDHMVLQSGTVVPVWGWADPGEPIVVSIAGQSHTAITGHDGKWKLSLTPLMAGGPFTLTVSGSNTIVINDALVGEVWIGSGQSNMGFPFKMDFFPYLTVKDYEKEKAAANFPEIRMFIVDTAGTADTPQENCRGTWHLTKPENVDTFSAELFFFGRELHQVLKVPVGLIKSAVGGTAIELWIDPKVQRSVPALLPLIEQEEKEKNAFDPQAAEAKYQKELSQWDVDAKTAKAIGKSAPRKPGDPIALQKRNFNPGGLFNSKIAPLIPYAIRGVLWHLGETNAGDATRAPYFQYQMPLLVEDWRKRWGYDFPFGWVQLANLEIKNGNWPLVREAFLKSLRLPHTGMAVTIDIGESHNIHFIDKQIVGHRLAMWALGDVYGKKVATSGPLPAGHERRGASIVLAFTHTDDGLAAKGGELVGFTISGKDRQWYQANAKIEGDQVVVSAANVPDPVAVRYAWAADPPCNLYNGAGLPASPFRTDDFP